VRVRSIKSVSKNSRIVFVPLLGCTPSRCIEPAELSDDGRSPVAAKHPRLRCPSWSSELASILVGNGLNQRLASVVVEDNGNFRGEVVRQVKELLAGRDRDQHDRRTLLDGKLNHVNGVV
jgi:hypothetical protein